MTQDITDPTEPDDNRNTGGAGEDDGSTEVDGRDDHLHDDQKTESLGNGKNDRPGKTQDLTKAGRPDYDLGEVEE